MDQTTNLTPQDRCASAGSLSSGDELPGGVVNNDEFAEEGYTAYVEQVDDYAEGSESGFSDHSRPVSTIGPLPGEREYQSTSTEYYEYLLSQRHASSAFII